MSIAKSLARVSRATAFLLAMGVVAMGGGCWLLYDTPVGATARALAHANEALSTRVPATTNPVVRVAMRGRVPGLTMQDASPRGEEFAVLVEVRAPVSGRVASVRFASGSTVAKGETLFELDPAPFVEAVRAAQLQLAAARARLATATADLGRSQRAFDDGRIDVHELDAYVRRQRDAHGTLREASETLENARRRLAMTRIAAPVDGRVAEVHVRVGDRVAAAPQGGVLVTIVSPESVYAQAWEPARYDARSGALLEDDQRDGGPHNGNVLAIIHSTLELQP